MHNRGGSFIIKPRHCQNNACPTASGALAAGLLFPIKAIKRRSVVLAVGHANSLENIPYGDDLMTHFDL
jgi:hypothetical protein